MGATIGDGKKYIRDFAVDFTDKETYISAKIDVLAWRVVSYDVTLE